ncbi:MAG: hypothetical protein RL679_1401 [Bacteroidota bacterium]|jgi:hypothetical protein
MKRIGKPILILSIVLGVFGLWYWADKKDYFQSNYKEFSLEEKRFFNMARC